MKSTLVKLFLILNLVFCAGVVAFSFQTFRDRELVNARNLMHQNNLDRIANNLNWGAQVDGENPELRQSGAFQLVRPRSTEDLDALTGTLNNLATVAESRLGQLREEHTELVTTRTELEETRETLNQKVSELADVRSKVSGLENELAETRTAARETTQQAASLQREITTLESRVENLDRQIAEREAREAEITRLLALRTGERDRIETLLSAARRPVERDGSVSDWHEKTASVLASDPEWNYVVIDKGEVDVLPLFIEAFVHRGDDFIGKIRIMQVERTVALAEVLVDTLIGGAQIQTGDTLFF